MASYLYTSLQQDAAALGAKSSSTACFRASLAHGCFVNAKQQFLENKGALQLQASLATVWLYMQSCICVFVNKGGDSNVPTLCEMGFQMEPALTLVWFPLSCISCIFLGYVFYFLLYRITTDLSTPRWAGGKAGDNTFSCRRGP